MKRLLLPVTVGFLMAITGLICFQLGVGLQFVILCIPVLTTLALMIVVEITELQETKNRINGTIMELVQATSKDFNSMKDYVDEEVHEVYMTIANERFGDSD